MSVPRLPKGSKKKKLASLYIYFFAGKQKNLQLALLGKQKVLGTHSLRLVRGNILE